jgi:hypothetical protein
VPWVLLDITIGVLALALLGAVTLRVYRRVRSLMRTVGDASSRVGELTPGLTVTPPPSR